MDLLTTLGASVTQVRPVSIVSRFHYVNLARAAAKSHTENVGRILSSSSIVLILFWFIKKELTILTNISISSSRCRSIMGPLDSLPINLKMVQI